MGSKTICILIMDLSFFLVLSFLFWFLFFFLFRDVNIKTDFYRALKSVISYVGIVVRFLIHNVQLSLICLCGGGGLVN